MTPKLKVELVRIERMCMPALDALHRRYKFFGCIRELRLSPDLHTGIMQDREVFEMLEVVTNPDDVLQGVVGELLGIRVTIDSPIVKGLRLPENHALVFYVDPPEDMDEAFRVDEDVALT